MFQIVANLIINLDRNVMDSSLTPFVQEYFELLSGIMEDETCFDVNIETLPGKYVDLMEDIQKGLKKHGWNINGFDTAPKRTELVKDINEIINRYFE